MPSKNGLLIDYQYCTGCHTCEVACQQEHNYPAGKFGITVTEHILETMHGLSIYYLLVSNGSMRFLSVFLK